MANSPDAVIVPYNVIDGRKVYDEFGLMLAESLGIKHLGWHSGYYPHEPIFYIDREDFKYGDLKGKKVILTSRFKQPLLQKHQAELSQVVLGIIALKYDLFNTHEVGRLDVNLPCLPINKQDHDPKTDPDPKVREKDKGKVPLVAFMLDELYPGRVVTYHGHNPNLRCGDGTTNLWGYDIVSLCLFDSLVGMLRGYPEFSNTNEIYVVSADKKVSRFSEKLAKSVGTSNVATLNVVRLGPNESNALNNVDVNGCHVIFGDDTAHTLSAVQASIKGIRNPGSITFVGVHSPITEEAWDRLQGPNGILTKDWGFPVRYVTTPSVIPSPEFMDHPEIYLLPMEDMVNPIVEFYRNQGFS